MRPWPTRQSRRRAFSLVETMIALALLGVVSVSYMSSMIVTARTTTGAKSYMFAVDTINRTIEQLRSATFANLGTNVGDGAQFMNPQTVQMDADNPVESPSAQVICTFYGFGTVGAASANSLAPNFPVNFPVWAPGQWTGRMIMIKTGVGRGQVAYITSSTATTLTITGNLDGTAGLNWIKTPAAGDTFEIDNGKTVNVRVSWTDRMGAHNVSRTALIPDTN